jgi:hypothetical protein
VTPKRPPYDLRHRRDREAALLGAHLARGGRVWWLAHEIWRQLAEPRAYRAGLMAHHAAVGGTSRAAVLGVLERFLAEVDAVLAPLPRPRTRRRGRAGAADDAAALARWRAVDRVIKRFERILAGKPVRPREPRPRPGATVLSGPWSAEARSPAAAAPKANRPSLPTVPPRD